jgi:hypothetical protein
MFYVTPKVDPTSNPFNNLHKFDELYLFARTFHTRLEVVWRLKDLCTTKLLICKFNVKLKIIGMFAFHFFY